MSDIDPLLALLTGARRLEDNNAFRAKLLADAARSNPAAAFQAYALKMIGWAQAEAVARDRAATPVDPLLSPPRPEAPRIT